MTSAGGSLGIVLSVIAIAFRLSSSSDRSLRIFPVSSSIHSPLGGGTNSGCSSAVIED